MNDTQICSKCDETKPIFLFEKIGEKRRKKCKECRNKEAIDRNALNPQIKRDQGKIRRDKDPEKFRKRSREYYLKNKDKILAKATEYRLSNIQVVQENARRSALKRYWDNPERHREKTRLTHLRFKEKYAEQRRQDRLNNPEKYRERCKQWKLNNPDYRLTETSIDYLIGRRSKIKPTIKRSDIPKEVIEVKKMQILIIKRA